MTIDQRAAEIKAIKRRALKRERLLHGRKG